MVEIGLACASWKNYCALRLYCNFWSTSHCFVHYYDSIRLKTFIHELKFRSIAKFTADEVTRCGDFDLSLTLDELESFLA